MVYFFQIQPHLSKVTRVQPSLPSHKGTVPMSHWSITLDVSSRSLQSHLLSYQLFHTLVFSSLFLLYHLSLFVSIPMSFDHKLFIFFSPIFLLIFVPPSFYLHLFITTSRLLYLGSYVSFIKTYVLPMGVFPFPLVNFLPKEIRSNLLKLSFMFPPWKFLIEWTLKNYFLLFSSHSHVQYRRHFLFSKNILEFKGVFFYC